ncbi:MAG: 3-hydroxyacyl-ACP dehydratase [Flavobacteriaceae bacterium]|nr:3-hydroxyacyl-ACP dehydratase [Flavobacteriaceae bacterium]
MILENFYKINNRDVTNDSIIHSIEIDINKDHPIFDGHFPGNPVMPGVCMMQIIKDITEDVVGSKLFMEKCSNVKFLAVINPVINPILNLELKVLDENGKVIVKNTTKFEETIALRLTAQYRKV